MEQDLLNRIESNKDIMFGKSVIKGTRLPVDLILEKLAYGKTEEEIIESYPFITKEDIKACLLYGAKKSA